MFNKTGTASKTPVLTGKIRPELNPQNAKTVYDASGNGKSIFNQAATSLNKQRRHKQHIDQPAAKNNVDLISQTSSQSKPFIILQRSPNVVNHFSLAQASQDSMSQFHETSVNFGGASKPTRRRNVSNKSTLDQLPTVAVNKHHS